MKILNINSYFYKKWDLKVHQLDSLQFCKIISANFREMRNKNVAKFRFTIFCWPCFDAPLVSMPLSCPLPAPVWVWHLLIVNVSMPIAMAPHPLPRPWVRVLLCKPRVHPAAVLPHRCHRHGGHRKWGGQLDRGRWVGGSPVLGPQHQGTAAILDGETRRNIEDNHGGGCVILYTTLFH